MKQYMVTFNILVETEDDESFNEADIREQALEIISDGDIFPVIEPIEE